jgi:hydroxypyruvate isomerase
MSADNDTDNPLSVDEAMDLIGKWETHPGLLMAIFDASRKLRDEVELLRDVRSAQQQQILGMGGIIAQHVKEKQAMQTELDQLRAVVAQNNQSLAQIVTRWIKPSKN